MKEAIRDYICSNILNNEVPIENTTSLYADGIISSMGHLKLLQFLERTFRIPVPMNEIVIEEFDTIDQIAAFVEARLH